MSYRNRRIVVYIVIVSTYVEMIDYYITHGMIKNMEGIKGTNVQDEQ